MQRDGSFHLDGALSVVSLLINYQRAFVANIRKVKAFRVNRLKVQKEMLKLFGYQLTKNTDF